MLWSTDPERLSNKGALKKDTRIFLGRGNRIYFEDGLGTGIVGNSKYQVRAREGENSGRNS